MNVTLYTKAGCHLCDEAKAALYRVRNRVAFELREIDVESDPELVERYGDKIPVVLVNGREAFRYRVNESRLESWLGGGEVEGKGSP